MMKIKNRPCSDDKFKLDVNKLGYNIARRTVC